MGISQHIASDIFVVFGIIPENEKYGNKYLRMCKISIYSKENE